METEAPELKVTTHPVGTFNQNKCILVRDSNNPAIIIKHTLGVTSPVQGSKMFNPYIPDVCFNVSANSWHFNVKTFEMNIIMGLCNDNIDLLDYKVINSFYDLEQIPTENICNALKALYGHYVYPYDVYPGDYIFTEIILKHEQTHVNEIKEIFSMYLPNFKNDFKKIILTCSDVQNETDARNQGRQEISKIFNKYMQQSLDIYNYKGKSDDEKDELKLRNEIKTNMNEEVFNLQVAYSLWLEQKALNLGLNCN
ncbi:MAG: hypothetical protein IPK06_14220 [Ignavibacteriae bacterium]|nr:hypothetical protein [Ignavibacteriota bacterium]